MTTPSGQISTNDVTAELGLGTSYSASLSFLNGYLKSPPASPNMDAFKNKAYYQNNTAGNCDNGNCGNCNCPPTDCTNCNCNCGNIQCTQCLPFGAFESQCSNCSGINCTNCDSQNYLQANCNCSGGYNCNCNATVGYNCGASASASYNCNCACNCSKIICTKLHEIGMMPYNIFAADQLYGEWLKKNDRDVYRGYIKWAKNVTSWIDGAGPDFMIWIKDKDKRRESQKKAATKWAYKIATPWSEHMAYLMGELKNDNLMGRIIMNIGRPICKVVFLMPKNRVVPDVVATWTMWFFFFFSYYTSSTYTKFVEKFKKIKNLKIFKEIKNV